MAGSSVTLRLTPETLKHAYALLRDLPPFTRWKLPPAEAVTFRVTADKTTVGFYYPLTDGHLIGISRRLVGYLPTLLSAMAHEMAHMRLRLIGKGNVNHGAPFKALAKQICKYHGFDPKEF